MMKFSFTLSFFLLCIGFIQSAEKELPNPALILAFETKLSVDLPRATTKNGAGISIWEYNKGENQIWYINKHGKGYVVSSFFSRQVLTVNLTDSTVIQDSFDGNELQYWEIESEHDSYRFYNKASGLYLTLSKGTKVTLRLFPESKVSNQQWYIVDSEHSNAIRDLLYGSYIDILKGGGNYNKEEASDIAFKYQSLNDSNLQLLRTKYKLDSIAGTGDEILKLINLMHWLHKLVIHAGNNGVPEVRNAFEMVKYAKKSNQGINCRGMAMILNECYLALGYKSRYVICLPKDSLRIDSDCHVINSVYSETLKKWIWIDPTFDAYVMDEKGVMQSIDEVREKIITGEPLIVNPDANWNNRISQTKDQYLYNYMAKNLYILECPTKSQFNSETPEMGKVIRYIRLLPENCSESMSNNEYVNSDTKYEKVKTHNSTVFWEYTE